MTLKSKKTAKPRRNSRQPELPLERAIAGSENARDIVRAMLHAGEGEGYWRATAIVPPGTPLDRIADAFLDESNIPLEMPFFGFLHHFAAYLLQQGVAAELHGQRIEPDLWSVMLAPQGSLKTLSCDWIAEGIRQAGSDIPRFGEPTGPAQFMEELAANNRTLWLRDEFGQFLKMLDEQSYMFPMKDLLLKAANTAELRRGDTVVHSPALVIYGLSVSETFGDMLPPESLLDGFASRFGFIIANARTDKTAASHSHFRRDVLISAVSRAWEGLMTVPFHSTYHINGEGEAAFDEAFRYLWERRNSDHQLPEGFFRRILFRGLKYGLLYHLFAKKTSDQIDADDMAWAGRLCALHMRDAKKLLDCHGLSEIGVIVQKIKTFLEKRPNATPRDIAMGVRGVKSTGHARELLALAKPVR